MTYGQIYARRLPPVEQKGSIERMKDIQQAIRDPEESPYVDGLGAITAAKLLKESQRPVMYTPRSLAEAASKARLPVPERQEQQVPQQRRVITEEDERILTAQAGGRAAIPQQVENVASKGRHGDTMLMHVNPDELKGLSSLLGPTTTNPDTGLPEAFAWWLPLIGAAIGGISTGTWKGAALGGLAGLGGAGLGMAFGAPGSIWTTAAGPLSGMLSGAGAGATGLAGGTGVGAAQGLYGPYAAAMQGAGTGAALGGVGTAASTIPSVFNANQIAAINAAQGSQALSSVPHTMGMGWGPGATGIQPTTIAPRMAANISTGISDPTFDLPSILRGEVKPSQYLKTDPSILQERATKFAQRGADYSNAREGAMATEPESFLSNLVPKPIKDWYGEQSDLTRGAIKYGIPALAGASLLSQPRQQVAELPIKEVSEFTFEDDGIEKEPRVPRTFTQEELEERIFTGLDPEDPSYFESTSFAKEGGLLSVIKRQLGGPAGFSVHPAIISAGPQAVAQEVKKQGYRYPTSDFGNPQTRATTHPLVIDALSQRSDWPSSWGGIGAGGGNDGIPATVEPPFEFPEVTPFRSVTPFSSSTLEDRLTRIAGQPTTPTQFPQVPLPEQAIPSTNIPDIGALSDLFTRYEEAQDDPIVNLVSSQVAEAIPAQKGGLLSLLFDREQRRKFDPVAALSPLYALKQGKYPEYYMPWKMMQGLAVGGTPNIFEGHVQGAGDGMADQIPFRVVPQTPQDIPKAPDMAVLSTDEFVFPADAVSMLGNGSSDAGAKILDNAVKSVRRASIGTPKQITEIDGQKVLGGALTT